MIPYPLDFIDLAEMSESSRALLTKVINETIALFAFPLKSSCPIIPFCSCTSLISLYFIVRFGINPSVIDIIRAVF